MRNPGDGAIIDLHSACGGQIIQYLNITAVPSNHLIESVYNQQMEIHDEDSDDDYDDSGHEEEEEELDIYRMKSLMMASHGCLFK